MRLPGPWRPAGAFFVPVMVVDGGDVRAGMQALPFIDDARRNCGGSADMFRDIPAQTLEVLWKTDDPWIRDAQFFSDPEAILGPAVEDVDHGLWLFERVE